MSRFNARIPAALSKFIARIAAALSKSVRRLSFWNLFAQAGIIVTGVAVRATGSGLGCPTWPQCTPGSYTPTVQQEQSWHKYVEFGNRTFTFVLILVAVLTLVAVLIVFRDDRRAKQLAWIPVLGTFAQAILGGISVRTGLNPYSVMAHFMLTIPLIWAAHSLWVRVTERPRLQYPQPIEKVWSGILVGVAVIVLFLGTVATGSGPHSGDAEQPARLGLDPATMSWIHASAVTLFLGLAVGMWAYAKYLLRDDVLVRPARGILDLVVLQTVVGFLQFAFGLPWWLLIVHAALSAWFWIAVLNIRAAVRD
jgi:cytochrome c oxidase assembly protein subunit 15